MKRKPPARGLQRRSNRSSIDSPLAQSIYGNHSKSFSKISIQAKLTIGQPNDKYEQEADRVADQVMRMSDADVTQQVESGTVQPMQIQRMCPECKDEMAQRQPTDELDDEQLQTKETLGRTPEVIPGFESRINSLKGGGQPLDPATRSFFEPRFGHDFSGVRVHADSTAADTTKSIHARAFTLGNHVVMGPGEYQPESEAGRKLLGHELTHVVQQSAGKPNSKAKQQRLIQSDYIDSGQVVRRDFFDDVRQGTEEFGKARLRELANQPTGSGGWGGSNCPHGNFCQPFTNVPRAVADLAWAGPLILAGIATKVNSRVVPLWATYLLGGSGVQNLSGQFGADFTNSPTTHSTAIFLVDELCSLVEREHSTLMGGASTVTLDVSSHLIAARRAINSPGDNDEMNFNYPSDIAGNIAGGIGTDQGSNRFGRQPSPVNDSRDASISVVLVRNASGTITVNPTIRFLITDTIDLCPGNCGDSDERVATVPLSRFEATGLVGDVPFIIDFDAPAADLSPFEVTPERHHGTVTASRLNYRAAPDTSAAILGKYPIGVNIELLCQTTGTTVLGIDTWYLTTDGFVSGRYVSLVGSGMLPSC